MFIKGLIVLALLTQVVPVLAVAGAMLRQHNSNGFISILVTTAVFLLIARHLWRRSSRKAARTR